MNVLPIVVLYNVDFYETNVYRTLLSRFQGERILIYENSPEPQNQCYETENILYHHDSSNGGVSAAYNYGATIAKQYGDVDAILLLDEDTRFEPDYLTVLQTAIEIHPDIKLFVPQVLYAGDQPFSPISRGIHKHRGALLGGGLYSLNDYLPVNSGACIRIAAFEKAGGYNPEIRLDFADFDFFSRLAVHDERFYRVDSVAHQSFSNEEKQLDRLFQRYQFYIEGARVAHRNPLIRNMVTIEVMRHTLALTARTRRLGFINYLIRNFR